MFRYLQNLFSPDDRQSTTIIIGLGPAGLAAAIETVKARGGEHRIVLITDRTLYERKPIYRINPQAYSYLNELIGHPRMLHQEQSGNLYDVPYNEDIYYRERYTEIRIDRTERELWRELEKHKKNFELITVSSRQHVTVHADTREVALADGRRIGFKYLIGADGVRHGVANQLIRQGVDLQYGPSHQRQIHSFHAISCYHLPDQKTIDHYRKVLLKSEDNKERLTALLTEMKKLQWTMHSFPEARIFIVENTLYVGAEAPRHQLRSDSAIDAWLRLVLRGSYSDADVDRLYPLGVVAEPRKNDTFEITLEEANKVVVPLSPPDEKPTEENTSYFIQLGDALRAPHYQTGSGVVQGLLGAKAWGQFLKSSQVAYERRRFSDRINGNMLENRTRVEKFLERRQERERLAREEGVHWRLSSAANFGFRTSLAIEKRLLRMIEGSSYSFELKQLVLRDQYHRIAIHLKNDQDDNAAIYYLTKAIEIYRHPYLARGDSAYPLHDRGMMYLNQGNYVAAVQDFKSAIALQPRWGLVKLHLAQVYHQQDKLISALEYAQAALKSEDYNDLGKSKAFAFRADLFVQLKQFSKALEDINQCISLLVASENRQDSLAASLIPYYIQRGNILHALGHDQNAQRSFARAARLEQGDPEQSAGFLAAQQLGLFSRKHKRRTNEITNDTAKATPQETTKTLAQEQTSIAKEKAVEVSHKRPRLKK